VFIEQLEKLNVPREKMSLECIYKYATVNIRDLFLCQFSNESIFNRFDIIVRYLAIENYYGKNDFGFKMYSKMQSKRLNNENSECESNFRELIKSYEENGYMVDSYIECDNEFKLFDGSHRLSLNIYHVSGGEIMVKIRLQRQGAKKAPFYHIVVADSRSPRDGKVIEQIGTYNPMTDPATIVVDKEKVEAWVKNGAKLTDSVKSLIEKAN